MPLMSSAYDQLLDATIRHLQDLKMHGARFISVSPETLAALTKPAPQSMKVGSATVSVASVGVSQTDGRKGITTSAQPQNSPAPTVARDAQQSDRDSRAPATQTSFLPDESAQATITSAPALSPEAKTAAFAELHKRALACIKCPHLASSRKNVVFGVGSIDAELMFVGEAPGADEDTQGEPFVGRAGELLTKIILAMGLRRENVYIGNILKCRPDTPGQASGNRKPTSDEMATCIPFLHEQIDLIRPKVLVALGGTAMEGLLNKSGITKLRGQWHTYRGTPLMPTYHPAYLLRNQSLSEKRKIWEDMLQVMEKLVMPISEKQRNYFLRG